MLAYPDIPVGVITIIHDKAMQDPKHADTEGRVSSPRGTYQLRPVPRQVLASSQLHHRRHQHWT